MVAHAFNLSTWEAEVGGFLSSEFKVCLDYRVSSRIAEAIQRNPVSNKQKAKKKVFLDIVNQYFIIITIINLNKNPLELMDCTLLKPHTF